MQPSAEDNDEKDWSGLLYRHSSTRLFRYSLVGLVCWNLFANHWARDSIGALEIPLESDYGLSVRQYNSLSAACSIARMKPHEKRHRSCALPVAC
jgi:hypothetical protein